MLLDFDVLGARIAYDELWTVLVGFSETQHVFDTLHRDLLLVLDSMTTRWSSATPPSQPTQRNHNHNNNKNTSPGQVIFSNAPTPLLLFGGGRGGGVSTTTLAASKA